MLLHFISDIFYQFPILVNLFCLIFLLISGIFIRFLVINHIYPISFIIFFVNIICITSGTQFYLFQNLYNINQCIFIIFTYLSIYHAVLYFHHTLYFLLFYIYRPLYPVELYLPQMSSLLLYHFLSRLYFHIYDGSNIVNHY